jgi:DNA segregation ATPase FtsK/SpoIIIE, S-DNA-T family
MGRRRKNGRDAEANFGEKERRPSIASDAKRGVVAVFLFALAVVLVLGFLGKAGVVGEFLSTLSGRAIGWVKMIFPLFLLLSGIILLLKKETSFYVFKLAGLGVVLASLTGFLHWFFATEEMLQTAKDGLGGGYLGYGVANLAVKYLGAAGGMVVIVALFFCGLIVAFNFSIMSFWERLINMWRKEEMPLEEENVLSKENLEKTAEKTQPEEIKRTEIVLGKKNNQGEENIGKIEFVEGPDRFEKSKGEDGLFAPVKKALFPKRKAAEGDNWKLPSTDLLEKSSGEAQGGDIEKNAEIIERTLKNFGIESERGEIKVGPAVTQYSFRPAVGIKISRILSLQNDLALALAAHPIRIEAPIPGKSLIGVEVPNKVSAVVRLKNILESQDFAKRDSDLTLALGKDVNGSFILGNLEKMPHLMIAGATGTGKSVSINSIITTLLYQNSPKNLKFLMIDPKRVELSLYNGIPHLLSDVIVDNNKVLNALKWAVGEMERRYRLLQDVSSRDLKSYNEKISKGEKRKYKNSETGESAEEEMEFLPFIVIIIDEVADLMGSHGKIVEGSIVRLAQMARAVGIHLIVSTQRPSVEVLTGLIKANITTRIAFQVATQIDSRTILDMGGAEKLLGNGDLLFLSSSSPKPRRIQGVFVSEAEVKKVVKFVKNQDIPEEEKESALENLAEDLDAENGPARIPIPASNGRLDFSAGNGEDEDDMLEAAKETVIQAGKASASLLQRRLRVGYARAARLLDIMEDKGIIGPADGAKPREVYVTKETPAYEDPLTDQEKRDKWQM